jgi:two-component system, response regulator
MTIHRTRSALLVEDDLDHVELFVRALRKAGIAADVTVANDGGEALELLFATGDHADRDPRELPQVVFLDLNLPRMGGLEVLARIRANRHTRHLPVLIFTSSEEDEDAVKSYDLGANGFVRKPVDYLEFVEAFHQLRRLGLYWLMEAIPSSPRHGRPA